MIVVDSNVLVYLYLPTPLTQHAERLRLADPEWVAPRLWRIEMRSALSLYLRKGYLSLEQTLRIQSSAEALLTDAEYDVPSADVLRLVERSTCSAYDCEFVALARALGTHLVTSDRKLLREFPEVARSLELAGA